MTAFVHCRGCGQQIHETAPTCPKCGAPQMLAAAAPTVGSTASSLTPPSTYKQVPWYRRRWFLILCILSIAPIAGVIALTGPLFYSYKSQPRLFPKSVKTGTCIVSVWWFVQLTFVPGSTYSILYMVGVVVIALILGFKRQWADK